MINRGVAWAHCPISLSFLVLLEAAGFSLTSRRWPINSNPVSQPELTPHVVFLILRISGSKDYYNSTMAKGLLSFANTDQLVKYAEENSRTTSRLCREELWGQLVMSAADRRSSPQATRFPSRTVCLSHSCTDCIVGLVYCSEKHIPKKPGRPRRLGNLIQPNY